MTREQLENYRRARALGWPALEAWGVAKNGGNGYLWDLRGVEMIRLDPFFVEKTKGHPDFGIDYWIVPCPPSTTSPPATAAPSPG